MEKYIDKITKILDDASCNESVDDYSVLLQEVIDECQVRIESVDYGRIIMIKDLDEAIQHCLEVAERNRKEFGLCPYPSTECDGLHDCRCLKNGKEKGCSKCAEEHRKLAEWLMDYKRLKEERGFLIRNEYRRGWHDALCKALRESYNVQCEGKDFEVVQVETLKGLGMSKLCALGKQPEELEGEI